MFVFSVRTWPAGSGPFSQSLPTPALDRHDTAAVWTPRLHDESGGPTSITGTARFVLAIFYIVITFLSGHTTPLISEEPVNLSCSTHGTSGAICLGPGDQSIE